MELTIVDYDMVHMRPSEIAAAALCLSIALLGGAEWVSSRGKTSIFWMFWLIFDVIKVHKQQVNSECVVHLKI